MDCNGTMVELLYQVVPHQFLVDGWNYGEVFWTTAGVCIFQKVLISSLPILPHHEICSPFHAHIFIVLSLISFPI